MEAVIGFVLGIATVVFLKEYPACRPRRDRKPRTAMQRQLQREYENFLTYDGSEQEDVQ